MRRGSTRSTSPEGCAPGRPRVCRSSTDRRDAGLVVHRADPLNCETSIPALIGGVVMPNARFYVRNHFETPTLDADDLAAGGRRSRRAPAAAEPARPAEHALPDAGRDARVRGQRPLHVRSAQSTGEQWQLGAVSTAEWTGVPLVEVLDRAGTRPDAREVVFRGADGGTVEGSAEPIRFERSLSLDDARDSGALLAYAMNGEPLPVQHGYPLRVIVPGWYSVTSVKWLTDIEVIGAPFEGFFQTDRYVYEWERDGAARPGAGSPPTGPIPDHRADRTRRRRRRRRRHPWRRVVGRGADRRCRRERRRRTLATGPADR